MSNMAAVVKVALLQLRSTAEKERNFRVCRSLIGEAAESGAKMIFLPENFDFLSENKTQSFELSESIDGNLINRYKGLAADRGVYLSLGGFHRQDKSVQGKVFNSHVVIDDRGVILSVYDKLHLFDVEIPNAVSLRESHVVEAGRGVVAPVSTPVGLVGLGICYDLRFPEFAQYLREMSADVLTYPASFTANTGAAHWHTLLKARAIENQCFVIAAAQEGQHNPKRCSYGHSIVIDPWGKIVAEKIEAGEGVVLCDIDKSLINKHRSEMPVFSHRRLDLFPSMTQQGRNIDIGQSHFLFGPHKIESSCVFYRSVLSFALVNISPLVPGHVLVCPQRPVSRFCDLSSMEVTDLYSVVRLISPRLANHFSASSLTISQQDGPDAGQSVPHVHIHVLPRKPGDFPDNDDIYSKLQSHDKKDNLERKFRSVEVMSAEAEQLRALFY